ncbi:MAG: sensor histidine kinase [Chloroflexota bacterium]|nr:MAG: sensor histidine kinase [Chloroflexota bacterium]
MSPMLEAPRRRHSAPVYSPRMTGNAGTSSTTSADLQQRILEAQEAERSRLAREIHDGPAQALANAILQIEVVERLMARDPALAGAELRLLRDVLRRELADVRTYVSQLRPPILADLGLSGAIRDTAEQVAGILSIPITVDLDPAVDELPTAVDMAVLRIIQETLQNVRKHAHASRVTIRATLDGPDMVLDIQDDGHGFVQSDAPAGGRRAFGIQFMQERAQSIGARLEVRSRPEDGTRVRLVIPGGREETT